MPESRECARAFGEGSDARLRGETMFANPYEHGTPCRAFWLRGWRHVADEWGEDARWPVRGLPGVGREAG